MSTSCTLTDGRIIWRTIRFFLCLVIANTWLFKASFWYIANHDSLSRAEDRIETVWIACLVYAIMFQFFLVLINPGIWEWYNEKPNAYSFNHKEVQTALSIIMPTFLVPYAASSLLERMFDALTGACSRLRNEHALRRGPY